MVLVAVAVWAAVEGVRMDVGSAGGEQQLAAGPDRDGRRRPRPIGSDGRQQHGSHMHAFASYVSGRQHGRYAVHDAA